MQAESLYLVDKNLFQRLQISVTMFSVENVIPLWSKNGKFYRIENKS